MTRARRMAGKDLRVLWASPVPYVVGAVFHIALGLLYVSQLEQRRQARIDARRRRRYEKREGLLFWFFALLLAGLVGLIGYGVVIVTRSVLG